MLRVEFKILCNGDTDITVSAYGGITLHKMTNYSEYIEDEENYPSTVTPVRVEVGDAYMCHHQIINMIEALQLAAKNVEARDLRWKKEAKKREKEAKAKAKPVAKTKKTTKKTKAKKK